MKNITLHQSTLEKFRECPQRLLFGLEVGRVRELRTAAQVAGQVAHKIVADWHISGKRPGYFHTWNQVAKSEPAPIDYGNDGKAPSQVVLGYARDMAIWFPEYQKRLAGWEPLQVEHSWEFSHATARTKANPYQFAGRLDLLAQRAAMAILADLKTGTMKPGDATMMRTLQFPLYVWAVEEEFDLLVDSFAWIHVKDWIPYVRASTKAKIGPSAAWNEWAAAQGFNETKCGTKWRMPVGAMRGPGIYEYPVTREWLEYWKKQIIRIAASMRRGNWYVCRGKYGCEKCDHLTACGAMWSTTGTDHYRNLKNSEFLNTKKGE